MTNMLKKFITMLESCDKNDLCGILPCDNNCKTCPVGKKEKFNSVINEIKGGDDANDMSES